MRLTLRGNANRRGRRSLSLGTPQDIDWQYRSQRPGVFRAIRWDNPADLGLDDSIYNSNFYPVCWHIGAHRNPSISTEHICSGSGSLLFESISASGQSTAGTWQCWTTDTDGELQFGENSEFWVQFQCRWNAAQHYIAAMSEGTKLGSPIRGQASITSDMSDGRLGSILQTWQGSKIPIEYVSGWYNGGLENGPILSLGSTNTHFETEMPNCTYANVVGGDSSGCFQIPVDEWFVVMRRIKFLNILTAAPYNSLYWNVEIDLYMYLRGQPRQLISRYDQNTSGYKPLYRGLAENNEKVGAYKILPFTTNLWAGLHPDSNVIQTGFTGGFAETNNFEPGDFSARAYSTVNTAATLKMHVYSPESLGGNAPASAKLTGWFASFWAWKVNAAGVKDGGGNDVTISCKLLQGDTVIFTAPDYIPTGIETEHRFDINFTGVTDWDDLYVQFDVSASGGSGGTERGAAITCVAMGGVHDSAKMFFGDFIWSTQDIPDPTTSAIL